MYFRRSFQQAAKVAKEVSKPQVKLGHSFKLFAEYRLKMTNQLPLSVKAKHDSLSAKRH